MTKKNKRYIYAYSMPHYFEKRIDANNAPYIKVGQTKRQPEERIKEQDLSANPEKLKLLKYWEVELTDYQVHHVLENSFNALRVRGDREWFECEIDDIEKAINVLISGVPRPDNYSLRKEQKEAIEEACNYYKSGGTKFLFNAKMRFGKTFTAYQLVKKLKVKQTLILTYVPTAVDQWASDLSRHIDFEEYNFYHALDFDKDNPIRFNKKAYSILFASFQDILGNKCEDKPKKKWAEILDHHYDFIIIDEAHWGYGSTLSDKILQRLSYEKMLLMSGTPLQLLLSGDYTESDTYTWSYIDEQKRKNDELKYDKTETYKWLPKLNIFLYKLGEKIMSHVSYYDIEEGPNLTAFFASEDGIVFKNSAAVIKWLELLLTEDERIFASPFNNNLSAGKINHQLWFMSGVHSINAMAKLLREHDGFKNYNIVVAADNNEGKGSDTLYIVRDAIRRFAKTITLSCGKLTLGVTVKEWTGIFMLSNTESPESYWQTAFRVQSSNKTDNKENCFLFDFDPNRAFRMIYSYSETLAKPSTSTLQSVNEFIDCIKVLSYSDNILTEVDRDTIVNCGINATDSIKKFGSKRVVYVEKFDQDIYDMLEKFDLVKTQIFEDDLSQSPLEKGKTKKPSKEAEQAEKKKVTMIEELRKKIIRIVMNLPLFMFVSNDNEESLDDILKSKEYEIFKETVGIELTEFRNLVTTGYIQVDVLNHAIEAFHLLENRINGNEK